MKFSCFRTDLVNALSNVSRVVSSKAAIPALEGVLIKAYGEHLNISGYNLEIAITTNIEATINNEGEIIINAKLLLDIARRLSEEIVMFETDERMVAYIKCGETSFQIIGMSSVDYPDIPTFEQTDSLSINSKILRDMIRLTVFAVSDNPARPVHMGSLFELEKGSLKIVATDGCIMTLRKESVDNDVEKSFVVPGKTQNEVIKLLNDDDENVEIVIGQRHIAFCIKNYRVISRLIEGTFLNYQAAIPKTAKTEIVINTRKLIMSVERMSIFTNDRIESPVRCNFSNDAISLNCASTVGSASDIISVPIIGEDVEIGFKNKYLLETIKNTDTDEIKLVLNGSNIPMVVKPVKGDSFLSLVLPMRLSV